MHEEIIQTKKSMKKIVLLLLLLVQVVQAQNKIPPRQKAKDVIRKTANVIHKAREQVKINKVYTGHLSKAVRHQKFARVLFREGKYGKAMQHSRRARQLAYESLKANKGKIEKEMESDMNAKNEKISVAELEKELPMEDIKEEDIIQTGELDVDLKENE